MVWSLTDFKINTVAYLPTAKQSLPQTLGWCHPWSPQLVFPLLCHCFPFKHFSLLEENQGFVSGRGMKGRMFALMWLRHKPWALTSNEWSKFGVVLYLECSDGASVLCKGGWRQARIGSLNTDFNFICHLIAIKIEQLLHITRCIKTNTLHYYRY